MSNLTLKQEAFVQAYLSNGGNAAEAYRAAYNASKMKPNTIHRRAHEVLNDSKVSARIKAIRAKLEHDFEVSQGRVVEELSRVVFNDPRRFFDEHGGMKAPRDWTPEMAAAVSSIEVVELDGPNNTVVGHIKKLRFWDKNAALTNMMKHLGMFERDNAQRTPGAVAQLPREMQRLIYERLRELAGNRHVPALAPAGSTGRAD